MLQISALPHDILFVQSIFRFLVVHQPRRDKERRYEAQSERTARSRRRADCCGSNLSMKQSNSSSSVYSANEPKAVQRCRK